MTVIDQPLATRPVEARRSFQPLAPIGNAGALKALLNTQRDSIADMLPKHISPERLFKTLLVATNRIPDLFQCTQGSLLETINRAAELGLDLSGTLGEAYPVPFNNKVKDAQGRDAWVKQCQLIIGYRGFVKLARQSGEVKRIDADVVCENDTFLFRKGSDARCEFIPNLKGDRGEPVGAYAYVQFKDGGEQFDFMAYEDIEKVRRRSKSGSNKDGDAIGAWKTDWPEMAKKTVFRRVAKWLPMSTEKLQQAIEQDDRDYGLTSEVLEASTGPRRSLDDRLAQRHQLDKPATHPDGSPIVIPPPPETEEEANARIEAAAAAAQTADDTQVEPDVSGVGAGAPEQTGEAHPADDNWPRVMPAEARKGPAWIDNAVLLRKPDGMTKHQAVKAFHAQHGATSWQLLDWAQQDAIYDALLAGETKWK